MASPFRGLRLSLALCNKRSKKLAGRNRALVTKKISLESLSSTLEKPCIFLSHISEDKAAVKAIGDYIMEKGNLDIYLDIYDDDLQTAVRNNDAQGITKFIERGLNSSTHLMCLYSETTVRSWWVPYEIGYGKRSNSEVSSLKLKGEVDLPAYLEVGIVLLGTESLNDYLEKIASHSRRSFKFESINESLMSHTALPHPLDNYLDWNK